MLTDKDLNILTLLRLVPEGPDQEELRVGLKYSLENRQNFGGVPILTPVGHLELFLPLSGCSLSKYCRDVSCDVTVTQGRKY